MGRYMYIYVGRGRSSKEGKVRSIILLLLQQQDNRLEGGSVEVVCPQREEEMVQLFGGLLTVHDDCSLLPVVGHTPFPRFTATTVRL